MEIIERISQLTRLTFGSATVDITTDGGVNVISFDGRTYRVEVLEAADGRLELLVDGRRVPAYASFDDQKRWVTANGRTYLLTRSTGTRQGSASHDATPDLTAPMPGQIRTVNVSAGDAVTKGQVLIVLEAMKMEIRLLAPFDGTVASIDAKVGQTVEREQVLIRLQHH